MGWWGGWAMILWWLPVLLVAIVVILMLRSRPGGNRSDPAEDALRERYARGEIDEETYRRTLAELRRR
jgi:putative membrane protein